MTSSPLPTSTDAPTTWAFHLMLLDLARKHLAETELAELLAQDGPSAEAETLLWGAGTRAETAIALAGQAAWESAQEKAESSPLDGWVRSTFEMMIDGTATDADRATALQVAGDAAWELFNLTEGQ